MMRAGCEVRGAGCKIIKSKFKVQRTLTLNFNLSILNVSLLTVFLTTEDTEFHGVFTESSSPLTPYSSLLSAVAPLRPCAPKSPASHPHKSQTDTSP